MAHAGWHSGEMADAEYSQREAAYVAHTRVVRPRLPVGLRWLTGEPMDDGVYLSLHDAEVERWSSELPQRFRLELLTWDSADRARHLGLDYVDGVEIEGATLDELATWLAGAQTTFLYEEADVLPDGRLEHRHLLWPTGEFAVRFATFELQVEPPD